MTEALKDTPEEKNSELIDAFLCYDWIISYTNPIVERLYIGNLTIPPYIKDQVAELAETEATKETLENPNHKPNPFLSSASINLLLARLVYKDIPLYKVGDKEISCTADIKRIWKETGLNSDILEWKEYYKIRAYLAPQRLEILKKLKAEKQDISQNKSTQNTFRLNGNVWEETTIVKKFINWLQNQRILAILVIVCLVIISVASFTDSIDKLVTFTKKNFYVPSTSKVIPDVSGSQNSNSPASSDKSIKREVHPKLEKEATLTRKESQHTVSNGKPSDQKPVAIETNTQVAEDKDSPCLFNIGSSTEKEVQTSLANEKKTTSQNKGSSPVIDKSRPVSKSDKDDIENRTSVNVASVTLRGETLSSRVQNIGALLPSLPDDLSAREIALLVGRETMSTRQDILELLVKRAKPRSLSPADIHLIIGSETLSSRVNCINIIAPYIKSPITGQQAIAILSSETHSSRVECLRPIAPLLLQPLSESDVQGILEGTSFSSRTQAIKLIFGEKELNSGPFTP